MAIPHNVTFGGINLLAVLAATWLLPVALYLPVMVAALVEPAVAVELGGVDPLTAKFQLSATVVASVLAVLTVRAIKATDAERQRSHERLMRFTADAAHELRSPLTLIHATLEHLVRQRRTAEEYDDRARTVLREVERLIKVTNSLLVLAQSDAGLLALRREPVELADVLTDVRARWAGPAAAAGLQLRMAPAGDAVLECDPDMIGRVLDNLVENAIRHTPAGGRVLLEGAREAGGWTVAVTDTGSGIPPAFRQRLFHRFSRADDGRGRGGAGLGLALCSAIAGAHGGSIELDPGVTTGTRIVVHLPVTPAQG